MTRETLAEANKLNQSISVLESQITSVENAQRNTDNRLTLDIEYIDRITVTDELRDDILDMVLKHLNKAKDNMEDALRLL